MQSIKQKLIEALDITLEDVSEERMLDILLDAYKAKNERIEELIGENAHEREILRARSESLEREHRRLREDPLYCAEGDWFFAIEKQRFRLFIQGPRIELFEQTGTIAVRAQQLTHAEFLSK